MRKPVAAAGSALFFALAPGSVAVLVPWGLTGWHAHAPDAGWSWPQIVARVVGAVLIAAGATFLISAFIRFVKEGLGTPAPVAPPENLVVGGVYRYIRNPMYVAVLASVIGQALLLWRSNLLWYAVILGATMFAFVRLYEEPTLASSFGADYTAYRKAVPGWWPRLRPWHPTAMGPVE